MRVLRKWIACLFGERPRYFRAPIFFKCCKCLRKIEAAISLPIDVARKIGYYHDGYLRIRVGCQECGASNMLDLRAETIEFLRAEYNVPERRVVNP